MANPVDRRNRRWAELARELEFTQLPELRRQAEGWRAGLTGLTALLAVRAAHGSPDHRILLAGQSLRTWTRTEITRVTRYLRYAAACCLAGIALSATAVIVVWATTESDPAPTHLIRVTTTTGERCGEMLGAGPDGVRIKPGGGKETLLPAAQVTSVMPVANCTS
ncbi:hypothetical protein [Streptomyces acidiscabies]|uniref:hypothetical protein n=1 Tax=Streptomyces acidiscabies TaxID=42234 RepID=UPI00095324FD|nr:hypothetical protein [Streptomyces acidiscabies]